MKAAACLLVGAAAGALATPAAARRVDLRIDRIESPIGVAQDLRASVDGDAAGAELTLRPAPRSGVAADDIAVACRLARDASGWRCAGAATAPAVTAARVGLVVELGGGIAALRLSLGESELRIQSAWSQPFQGLSGHARLRLAELQDGFGRHWPGLILKQGRIDLDLRFDARAASAPQVAADLKLQDVAAESRDGSLALAGLSGGGALALRSEAGSWRLAPRLDLEGGEILLGSVYASLPSQPLHLSFELQPLPDGAWALPQLRLEDPGTLQVELAARLRPGAAHPVAELNLRHVEAQLPQAYARYGRAWAASRGWGELALRGRLRGAAHWQGEELTALHVLLQDVALADGGGRLGVTDLRADLAWEREGAAVPGTLSWREASLYRVVVGAVETRWRSGDGALSLEGGAAVPLLGGTLEIPRLTWRPGATRGERVALSLAVHGVDLAQLSRAFGWPAFRGTLGGAVPSIHYADDGLTLDGGLSLRLFDGDVNVTGLVLERPFGVAPALAANLAFSGIDLRPLTAAFGFGEITGRLGGRIAGLRLLGWRPVAFDAELLASDGGTISQRAVRSLSSVGGGGLAAGLQAQLLRVFDTFGYRRIRLACRLADDVCHMGGLDSSGDGYTLVEGRGLPRIAIVGHQREVDWPTLIQRLRDATSGNAPIVR